MFTTRPLVWQTAKIWPTVLKDYESSKLSKVCFGLFSDAVLMKHKTFLVALILGEYEQISFPCFRSIPPPGIQTPRASPENPASQSVSHTQKTCNGSYINQSDQVGTGKQICYSVSVSPVDASLSQLFSWKAKLTQIGGSQTFNEIFLNTSCSCHDHIHLH